jgi:exodeoxyribonuclease V beta subunit
LVGGDAAVERSDALQESDEGARKLYVALTRGRDEVVAWVSNRAQLHADDGTANAVFVSSLWLQLVEPIGFLDDDEVARMADAAGGVPFGRPSIEHVVREHGVRRTGAPREVPAISTKDVTARPQIDESLRRRWSYSFLGVAGVDVARPDPADVDDDPGFDAGSLAESELDPELLETTRDGSLFGGFAGAAVGNALHAVLEALVGEVASGDLRTKRDLVLKAFASEGLVLDDPDPVCDQLAVVLSRQLGPMMDNRSLDSFVTPDATKRLAKEMNFTVALHASGAPHDLVGEIAELALEHDAEGPYRAYFEGLRREHATSARLFQGFLNGSIDLVAQVDDTPRFVVVDYKSNVAAKGHGYSPDELVAKMAGAGYPLQALLYSVALHRYLDQRLDDYDAEANLGGALYLFLRGMVTAPQGSDQGLAAWKLPARLVVATSELLGEGATHDA